MKDTIKNLAFLYAVYCAPVWAILLLGLSGIIINVPVKATMIVFGIINVVICAINYFIEVAND